MTTPLETIEAEALKLTLQDRALLIDRLSASIPDTLLFDQEWFDEVMRRDAAIDAGIAGTMTIDGALARARRAVA